MSDFDFGAVLCECGHPKKNHNRFEIDPIDGWPKFIGCSLDGCGCKKFTPAKTEEIDESPNGKSG